MSNIRRIIREFITEKEDKQLLGEGLIKTVHPDTVMRLMNRWNNGKIELHYTGDDENLGFIEVAFSVKTKEMVDRVNTLMNNYGYFPSTWFKLGDKYRFNDLNHIDYDNLWMIRYEPKFDLEYRPKQRYLYHVTDMKYLNKIEDKGLSPRSKNKITKHPDRIYLAKNKRYANEISEMMGDFIPEEDQIMLKIDMKGLPIFLMQDGQYPGGVYTTHNIPPKHIMVLK
jgi:hypothetical protein